MNKEIPDGYIFIGKLGKTFGLQGGVRFRAAGDAEEAALKGLEELWLAGLGERGIKELRYVSGQPVLFIVGFSSIELVKPLVNTEVYAPEAALPEPEEGEFYLSDVIGLPVFVDDRPFGTVEDVLEAGAQDVLIIMHDEREVLVPLQADYVDVYDDKLTITDPPEGLLEP